MNPRDRQNILAGLAVAVIIGLALWLGHLTAENIKMQNCVFSGRRNCNPVPMDDSR
jgi:hypothetical protein